jgi:hypothetical protein
VEQVRGLIAFCRAHLEHENAFVHTSMEARAPGSTTRIGREHAHHSEAIDDLEERAATLGAAAAARTTAAEALYSKLALFVGENFVHMHAEETENNAIIWRTHGDEEILAIQRAIVAALAPQKMADAARWMIPALNPPQRAEFLSEIRQAAPPPVFESLLGVARSHLTDLEWRKLAQALMLRAAA